MIPVACRKRLVFRSCRAGPQEGDRVLPAVERSQVQQQCLPEASTRRKVIYRIGGALASIAATSHLHPSSGRAEAQTIADATPPIAPAEPLSERELAIINVFESTTNSVVNIFDATIQGQGRFAQVDQPEGNGSGFIWDHEGHVCTNYHVLASALQRVPKGQGSGEAKVARVTVLGTDGYQQTYDAYLVGADRSKDLAVLKINAPQEMLQPVNVGQSGSLRVGQQVLCIGNPFGFDHTLTTGVISGLGREIQSRAGVLIGGGIQTDAAINPGNSGGPLLDSAGRVIGVNTAIFTNTGTSAGVGFAIPIDAVARAVPQLIQFGKLIRPSLRIEVSSDQVARALKISNGALVQSVLPNSNAAKAGLLPTRRSFGGIVAGDVIIGIDGRKIRGANDLVSAMDEHSIGDKVSLTVLRDATNKGGKEVSLDLVLEEEVS